MAKQVEISLLQENAHLYMVNGNKNWSLLRKHVFIIEKYCKDHFSGKIPAKHNISDILSVALEGTSRLGDPTQSAVEQTRVKFNRGNPARNVLETHGISFPDPNNASSAQSAESSSNFLNRCKPITKEEERAQLDIALRQSVVETNTPLQFHHESLAPTRPYRHSTKHGLDWTGQLDWTVGLDSWTGQLDWTVGLDSWTGQLDWTIGLGFFSIK